MIHNNGIYTSKVFKTIFKNTKFKSEAILSLHNYDEK